MKRQRMRRLLALLLTLTMVLTLVPGAYARDEEENTGLTWKQVDNSAVSASIGREEVEEPEEAPLYDEDEQVRVSIVLEGEPTLAMYSLASEDGEEADAFAYREELQAYQDAAAEYISEEVLDEPLDVVWNLTLAANIISANVAYGKIEALKAADGVKDVIVEQRYDIQGFRVKDDPNLVISTGMTNTADVWNNGAGYTGAGMRVAIIDTGLDIEHQSFNNGAFLHALEEDAAADGVAVSSYDLLDAAEIEGVLSQLNAAQRSPDVAASDFYHSEKLPFNYCYIDEDLDVTHEDDTQGEHGSHVAGIAAANRYLKKEDGSFVKAIDEVKMVGNAPDAQVLVMKVFGNAGGAYPSDYFVAIEDAIVLGCDTVNLSLGSGNAGMITAGEYQSIMDNLANTDTVVTISAGNSGQWAEQTSTGLPYSDDVNFQTSGSPGTYTNSLGVASVDNNGMVASGSIIVGGEEYSFTETQGPNSEPLGSLDPEGTGTEYDYVFIDGVGKPEDFAGIPVSGKVAFCKRGEINFSAKATAAAEAGAIATIVYNNEPGTFGMVLSDYTGTAPAVSITQADAARIKAASTPVSEGEKTYYTGRITVKDSTTVFPGADSYETMSDFSSWGVPGDLSIKPEITAPGGNIWSLNGAHGGDGAHGNHDAYESMSGTSMAAPQMAGIGALVKQYIENENLSAKTDITDRALAQSLMMSTAVPLKDAEGSYYSILQQGAGMVDTRAAVNADSYILMGADATASYADGKVKVELGDDPGRTGSYSFTFSINNLKNVPLTYTLDVSAFTQGLTADGVGNYYLTTETTPLEAELLWNAKSVVANPGGFRYDFDGNGAVDLDDGNALLDYVTGARGSLYHQDEAYFGQDAITSYNGHLFLQKVSAGGDQVTVPANSSVTISATIELDQAEMAELMEYCPNGAYVEAYVFIDTVADAEGALRTSHSIPVLGFYGNWTDPTMFDKGSFVEYLYGLENRDPYMFNDSNMSADYALEDNYLAIRRNDGEFYYTGNPFVRDDRYMPERNAFSSTSGDMFTQLDFTPIRNAADGRLLIRNAETGEVYMEKHTGSYLAVTYLESQGAWVNLNTSSYYTGMGIPVNWAGTDAAGAPLAEDTKVEISFSAAPELYVQADGSIDWDALGAGASLTTQMVIDNTAPHITEATFDPESLTLTVKARDNQYVAAAALFTASGDKMIVVDTPNQEVKGAISTTTLELDEVVGEEFLVQVFDYAGNASTYEFTQTLAPTLDTYYSGYDRTERNWVSYNQNGGKVTVGYGASNLDICAGAYARGYVFAYDYANRLYAVDASKPSNRTLIAQPNPDIYSIADMAYDEKTDTMYLLYRDDGWRLIYLGSVDMLTGEVEQIAYPYGAVGELCGLAADGEGTLYGVSVQGGLYTLSVQPNSWGDGFDCTCTAIKADAVPAADGESWNGESSLTWDSRTNELVFAANTVNMDYQNPPPEGRMIYTIDPTDGTSTEKADLDGQALVSLYVLPETEANPIVPVDTAESITLTEDSLTLLPGDSVRLGATVGPWYLTDTAITWSSDNTSVATVDQNGRVRAAGVGSTTITAASHATPAVTAQCMVEVREVSVDLTALVWGTDEDVWWSEFTTDRLPDYTPIQLCPEQFASAAMDDGTIHATTIDLTEDSEISKLYTVDPDTWESTLIGPVMARISSSPYAPPPANPVNIYVADLAESHHIVDGNRLIGLYGSNVVAINKETGMVENYWSLRSYTEGADLIAIAYLGEQAYTYRGEEVMSDLYALIDNDGYLYIGRALMGVDWQGNPSPRFETTPVSLPTGFYADNTHLYNSAVHAVDENGNSYLFWSRYVSGASSSDLIVIELTESLERGELVSRSGEFPYNVWPVGGLMVKGTIPSLSQDTLDALASLEMVEVPNGEEAIAARSLDEQFANEADLVADEELPDDLETLDMDVTSNSGTASVSRNGRVTVMVTLDKASTNGLIEASYDARDLELVSVNGKATLNSANTSEDGKVVLAYAYKHAAASRTTVAELVFTSRNKSDTTVTLTQKEDGTQTGLNTVTAVAVRMPADPYYPGGGGGGGSATQPGSKPGDTTEPGDSTEPGDTTIQPPVPVVPDAAAAAEIVGQYEDLTVGSWYQEAVAYVVANNLMSGTGDGSFSPNTPMSRAMLVTVLHRAAGLPAASGSAIFSDVASGTWYSDAVDWAASSEIVGGVGNGNFNPNGNVSRQELAVILWRYAQMLGLSVATDGTTMPDFADRDQIAAWAGEAMSWAYRTGILTGDGNSLRPTDGASRVEAAAMLTRFMKLVENSRDPKM